MKLPPPPDRFATRETLHLYEDLGSLLDQIRPGKLDWERVTARFEDPEFQVILPHTDNPEWRIGVYGAPGRVTVRAGNAHPDFESGDPRWWFLARTFINDVMRGRIEVVTKMRGEVIVSVTHRNIETAGNARGSYGTLPPRRATTSWGQPEQKVVRMDFGAAG